MRFLACADMGMAESSLGGMAITLQSGWNGRARGFSAQSAQAARLLWEALFEFGEVGQEPEIASVRFGISESPPLGDVHLGCASQNVHKREAACEVEFFAEFLQTKVSAIIKQNCLPNRALSSVG